MAKISIPGTNQTYYFEPHEIICMQAAHKRTLIFHLAPKKPEGYDTKFPCGSLKVYEEKVKDHACFMRVHDSWMVNLNHVSGLTRNNIISLDVDCCKQGIDLNPKLRREFQQKMAMTLTVIMQLPVWVQQLSAIAA